MRIVVLGGGVVGVTTAYQLQRDGHEVVVLERNGEVAAEASFGNAGMIAPGHSFVWSSPRAPLILAKSLILRDQALRFKISADPHLYAWSWGFLKECTAEKARRNTLIKHRLAVYSQTVLDSVVAEEAVDYDRNVRGILYLHRAKQALDAGVEHMKLLELDGQIIKVLNRDQVIALEPALRPARDEIAGAILCPTDETGDCAKFTRIDPQEIKRLVPALDVSQDVRYPILGALYHAPGGIIRHDAVNWGYARGVDAAGIHIHQKTEVTGIDVANDRVVSVRTTRGKIATRHVLNCTAGSCSVVAAMAGVTLPIVTLPLQAAVTEPVRHFLGAVIVSGTLHVYVSQTDRGELVFGASVDPFGSYSMRGSLEFTEELASQVLELIPSIAKVRLVRQWAGLCDMTPDFSPVMGVTPVEGFYVDVGWGTYGFKAGPVSGEAMAQLVASGKTPGLIAPFCLARFSEGRLVGEKGAASVGH